jgi:hypothetical protein|tara:strand:- start:246 stop:575 length:330 start_codon:yes stop_codon:yes gene_type:complete
MPEDIKKQKSTITLKYVNKEKIRADQKRKANEFLRDDLLKNTMRLTDKVDIKGYALCVWDEKGAPCLALNTRHPENIISEFLIPSFLSSTFQGIINNKIATSEVYKDDD